MEEDTLAPGDIEPVAYPASPAAYPRPTSPRRRHRIEVGAYVHLKFSRAAPSLGNGGIRYVGPVEGRDGIWYGIALDEPNGWHNGNPNQPLGEGRFGATGQRYFTCPPMHGLMLRPDAVRCT